MIGCASRVTEARSSYSSSGSGSVPSSCSCVFAFAIIAMYVFSCFRFHLFSIFISFCHQEVLCFFLFFSWYTQVFCCHDHLCRGCVRWAIHQPAVPVAAAGSVGEMAADQARLRVSQSAPGGHHQGSLRCCGRGSCIPFLGAWAKILRPVLTSLRDRSLCLSHI